MKERTKNNERVAVIKAKDFLPPPYKLRANSIHTLSPYNLPITKKKDCPVVYQFEIAAAIFDGLAMTKTVIASGNEAISCSIQTVISN